MKKKQNVIWYSSVVNVFLGHVQTLQWPCWTMRRHIAALFIHFMSQSKCSLFIIFILNLQGLIANIYSACTNHAMFFCGRQISCLYTGCIIRFGNRVLNIFLTWICQNVFVIFDIKTEKIFNLNLVSFFWYGLSYTHSVDTSNIIS